MEKSRTLKLALTAVVCLSAICACQRERMPIGSFAGNIKAKVNSSDISTKSAIVSRELTQTLEMDGDDIVLQEYVSDNLSQPFGEGYLQTKGKIITGGNIAENYNPFWMESFLDNYDEIDADPQNRPTLTNGDQYIQGGQVKYESESWNLKDGSGNPYPWLNNIQFRFWSYAPKGGDYYTFDFGSVDARSIIHINDFVNLSKAEDQKDIIVAYNNRWYNDDNKNEYIDIMFRHALAAINFNVDEITDFTIKKIEIARAYNKGKCDIDGEDLDDDDVTAAFAWNLDETSTDTFVMTGANDNFFMLPQTLPADAQISITFEKNGNTYTRTASLSTTWKAGKIYTYKLSVQGDVADADVTAIIETTYGYDETNKVNIVTGSDAKLTLTKTSGTVNQWTLKNVKFYQGSTDFRSTASVNVTSGTPATIAPVSGKPYMPKTDTGGAAYSWTADIYYTVNGGEHKLKTVTGTVNAPGPAADKFEIKMNFDGYTNFSVAKGYDGQTKNVTKANNTDVSKGGMDKETVYNVGGKKYVSGLSADVYTQCSSLLKCEGEDTKYDGEKVSGTGVNYTKQAWKAHTISCYAEFDGVAPNTQPSKKVHITGLPYAISHPANTNGWTRHSGDISWDSDKIDLGYDTKTREPIVQSPYFHIPEDLNVRLSGNITSTGSANIYDLEIKPNGVSDKYVHTNFNKNNPWQGPLDATMEKGQFWWEIQHHNLAIYTLHCYVYSFNVDYRD